MKVVHILKDGTRRDSMKGFVIPVNKDTEHIYQTIARIQMELAEKQANMTATRLMNDLFTNKQTTFYR